MHKNALVERAISEHGETKFQTKMKQHLNELLSVKLKKIKHEFTETKSVK